ncbi:DUF4834 domain-containing protein [Robiginitalea sp. M366]|uniref:DUF4834 domain-containing protein n=1 Tax=Robiginitalea aestuariiviva TaxID=3036903 RepID=UPI00240E9117|nr:DUF4834 domain-containing protein [Robiginitalea aestuariiviva]MDG1573036.1 DUF4834 domain-containing protein [Robiginitalea aestuariiviva]
MGILQTVLIVFLVYYALVLLGRILRPWLRAYARKKAEAYFGQAFGNQPSGEDTEPVGKVTVQQKPDRKPRSTEKVGEYIAYEEID